MNPNRSATNRVSSTITAAQPSPLCLADLTAMTPAPGGFICPACGTTSGQVTR